MMTAQHDPLSQIERASELIDQVERRTGGVASQKQLKGIQRRTSRLLYAAVAVCLMISLATGLVVALMVPRLARTEASTAVNTAAIESALVAREQLRQAGVAEQDLPPIPTPKPAEEGVDIDSIVDTITARVLAEVRSDPRYRGPAGEPGAPCDPAIDERCIGPEGAEGVPGEPGKEGPMGEQGEPCSPDIDACRGPAGKDAPRIVNAGPARTEEGICVFRTTLENGTTFDAPTREENCPAITLPDDEDE